MTNDPLANLHGPRRLPAPGGADLAVTAGRRRLRRRRTATTAAGVSLGVVATAAFAGGARPDAVSGLLPSGRSPRSAASGTPSPGLPAALPTALPSGVPTLLPSNPPPPPPESPTEPPSEAATATAAPRAYVGLGSRTIRVSTTNDPAACANTHDTDSVTRTGFCSAMTGPMTLRTGTSETYAFRLCRAAGQQPKTLTFSTAEVRLGANRFDTPPDWTLTDDAAKHTVTFVAGDCRTWTFEWMGQDDAGYSVPADSYEVLGFVTADEWIDENGPDTPPAPASVFVDVS